MSSYRTTDCQAPYKKLFRYLTPEYPRKAYTENKEISMNCHYGQRKLLFTEIEFLSLLAKRFLLRHVLVVYIGSAAGFHLPIIFDMFPDVSWILIDPAPFKFLRTHKYAVHESKFTIINDFYNDESYNNILNINRKKYKRKHIAFISDIRLQPTDQSTFRDMLNQQKWLIQLQSCAYMLKFRLPYASFEYKHADYQYTIDYTTPCGMDMPPNIQHDKILYLGGKIYTQLYPPNRSSESRLIGFRATDQPFAFTYYDALQYDENMNYFNKIDRVSCYRFKGSRQLKKHILGFDDGYESVSEFYLIWKYFQRYKKIKPDNKLVVNFLFKVSKEHDYLTHRTLIDCIYKTLLKRDMKMPTLHLGHLKRIHDSLSYQLEHIQRYMNDPKILTKEDYTYQYEVGTSKLHEIGALIKQYQ